MIGTVLAPTRRPIGELPEYCRLVGACGGSFPVRVTRGSRSGRVMVLDLVTLRAAPFDAAHVVDALVPESWDEAKWDISLDLMNRGAL